MPGLERAAKLQRRAAEVGFDWTEVPSVIEKLREEVGELEQVLGDPTRVDDEIGDLLFTVVNVSRHLAVDPELALRRTIGRFSNRFRAMEAMGPLDSLTAAELDERWEKVKSDE
jgi:ATP diphosphatase